MDCLCDLCGNARLKACLSLNPGVTLPGTIVRCSDCGLVFKVPLPTKEQMEKLYGEGYARDGFFMEKPVKARKQLKRDLNRVITFVRNGEVGDLCLLDVGCGNGDLLRSADMFTTLLGIEPCPALRDKMLQDGFAVLPNPLEEAVLPEKYFHLATMHEVLEHVASPSSVLQAVHRTLATDGLLWIRVPNNNALIAVLARLFKNLNPKISWSHPSDILYGEYHTYFFTLKTLQLYLKKSGFEVLDVQYRSYTTRPNSGSIVERWGIQFLTLLERLWNGGFFLDLVTRKKEHGCGQDSLFTEHLG